MGNHSEFLFLSFFHYQIFVVPKQKSGQHVTHRNLLSTHLRSMCKHRSLGFEYPLQTRLLLYVLVTRIITNDLSTHTNSNGVQSYILIFLH